MLEEDSNRRRQRRRLSEDEWQVVFTHWRSSNLSKTGYCKARGITLSCFIRWYRRLSVDTQAWPAGLQSPAQEESPPASSLGDNDEQTAGSIWSSFIPVRLDGDGPDSAAGLKLEVVLSKGHRVCVEGVLWRDVLQFLSNSM